MPVLAIFINIILQKSHQDGLTDGTLMEQECHSDTGAVAHNQHNTHQPISVLIALTDDSTLTVLPHSMMQP